MSVAGRVTNIRKQGKNLIFYDIVGDGKRLQIICNIKDHKEGSSFEESHSVFRRGDIIGVVGRAGRSNTNELSLAPSEIKLLSPCLHMLP